MKMAHDVLERASEAMTRSGSATDLSRAFHSGEDDSSVTYHQQIGFATGVACGAEVACLYLAILEERVTNNIGADLVFYVRYIDDGMGAWQGSRDGLVAFLNSLFTGSGLDITNEIADNLIVFLDMEIFRRERQLVTRCYQKASNAYLYLPFSSEHPPHVFIGFIKGELIRYVKRCFLFDDFCIMVSLFSTRLRARGYPAGVVRRAFKLVSFAQRARYLEAPPVTVPVDDNKTRCIALVMKFSRQNVNSMVHQLYRRHLAWLPEHFNDVNFVTGWRASSKLSAALVTYRFPRQAARFTTAVEQGAST